jgi:hypothetical protein
VRGTAGEARSRREQSSRDRRRKLEAVVAAAMTGGDESKSKCGWRFRSGSVSCHARGLRRSDMEDTDRWGQRCVGVGLCAYARACAFLFLVESLVNLDVFFEGINLDVKR